MYTRVFLFCDHSTGATTLCDQVPGWLPSNQMVRVRVMGSVALGERFEVMVAWRSH